MESFFRLTCGFQRPLLLTAAVFLAIARHAFALTLLDPVTDPLLAAPLDAGKPVAVQVTLNVLNIPSIDEVNEQFTLDGYLLAQWADPGWRSSGPPAPW